MCYLSFESHFIWKDLIFCVVLDLQCWLVLKNSLFFGLQEVWYRWSARSWRLSRLVLYSIRLFDLSVYVQLLQMWVVIEDWELDLLNFDEILIVKFEGFEEGHTMGDLYDDQAHHWDVPAAFETLRSQIREPASCFAWWRKWHHSYQSKDLSFFEKKKKVIW